MPFDLLIPVAVAMATVVQAGLNNAMSESWGLPGVVVLNAVVFLVGGVAFYGFTRAFPALNPQIFDNLKPFSDFKAWYVLPGLCGIVIVLGLPMGLASLGALKLFTILVGSQIVLGLLWDIASGGTFSATRVAGAIITLIGVAVSMSAP